MTSKLTIIIPAFNEEKSIAQTLKDILLHSENYGWQVIVVNDGSTDGTYGILNEYKGRCKIIHHPYNKGYGASLKTGIRSAKTDFIATYDSDGQHRPGDLKMLWDKAHDYDMVVGQRDVETDVFRIPGKWILKKTANILLGRKIPDLNSGLRIFRTSFILKVLHLMPEGFSFTSTSTLAAYKMGYSVGYLPIHVTKRIGTSTVRQTRHGFLVIMLILRLIILFSPLRIFLPVSALLALIGSGYAIYVIITVRLMLANGAVLFLLTSLIIFFFGLLVDQVSAMRRERYMYDK
jgi:glycosyltransferase involved in cell wall biosynthesis